MKATLFGDGTRKRDRVDSSELIETGKGVITHIASFAPFQVELFYMLRSAHGIE